MARSQNRTEYFTVDMKRARAWQLAGEQDRGLAPLLTEVKYTRQVLFARLYGRRAVQRVHCIAARF